MPDVPVVNRIRFMSAPAIGTVLLVEGQRYEVCAVRPHCRQDGTETLLIVWRGHCAECGRSFEQTTTLKSKAPNRRCPEHRKPGRPVTRAGWRRKRRFLSAWPRASPHGH
jgi:hypothetical protein